MQNGLTLIRKWVWRVVKWSCLAIVTLLIGCVVFILSLWGSYRHIVNQQPGALETAVSPGIIGKEVDPFIGTGGVPWLAAYNTPAATAPFSMVRLGPDTMQMLTGFTAVNPSGYCYGDNKLIGFSHSRLIGADSQEGGTFRFFPTVASRVKKVRKDKERFARFSHKEEAAFPGYYAVRLPKDKVRVELTVSPRVGMHRYTFEKDETPHLLVDVSSALGERHTENGVVTIYPEKNTIEGSIRTYGSFSGRYNGLNVYFTARFSQPFESFGAWSPEGFRPGAEGAVGDDIGVDLSFANRGSGQVVEAQVALSYVSIENARKNLDAEGTGRSFETIAKAAGEAWEKHLSRIEIDGGTNAQRRTFYTALYRTMQMPTEFNDVNGEYRGFDEEVHQVDGFRYFTDLSLWDTFRTLHPLYNLIARDEQRDMMISMVDMAQKGGGGFPRWPSGCGYTNCMLGSPADIAVTEAYLKGIRDFDIEAAYQEMKRTALMDLPRPERFSGRRGLEDYLKFGYCPADRMGKSVSKTLEYAYADYSLSLLAKELGRSDEAAVFAEHAQFYKNVWNPESQFFHSRNAAGDFIKEFRPLVLTFVDFKKKYTDGYVEGSPMQWRWAVPFDPEGLIGLFKSKEFFISELERYMENVKPAVGAWNPGSFYWQGNEPYIHSAYLFNTAGRPDLTQKWVRWLMDNKYDDTYVGLDGNDDGGTLSAWYVFSALGFYPIAGTKRYEIGTPLFEGARIWMGEHILQIEVEDYAPDHPYVQQVWINGVPWKRTWFSHDEIAEGGVLRFKMGAKPVLFQE